MFYSSREVLSPHAGQICPAWYSWYIGAHSNIKGSTLISKKEVGPILWPARLPFLRTGLTRVSIYFLLEARMGFYIRPSSPLIGFSNKYKRIKKSLGRVGFRKYSTESTTVKSNILYRLNKLNQLSKNLKPIDRTLYGLVCNLDMLKLAYKNISFKSRSTIPDIEFKIVDEISLELLKSLQLDLKTEKFQFKPFLNCNKGQPLTFMSSRAAPLKKAGKFNNFLISNINHESREAMWEGEMRGWPENVVQEILRLILEAIYEPRFQDESHGFRPNRNCHTALNYINQKFNSSV
jgi:hypothetical protein